MSEIYMRKLTGSASHLEISFCSTNSSSMSGVMRNPHWGERVDASHWRFKRTYLWMLSSIVQFMMSLQTVLPKTLWAFPNKTGGTNDLFHSSLLYFVASLDEKYWSTLFSALGEKQPSWENFFCKKFHQKTIKSFVLSLSRCDVHLKK